MVEEIFPKEEFDARIYDGLSAAMNLVMGKIQQKFANYNFAKSLQRFLNQSRTVAASDETTTSRAKPNPTNSSSINQHVYFADSDEASNMNDIDSKSRSKKRKRRGSRAGKAVKQRISGINAIAPNPMESSPSLTIMSHHGDTTTVGNHLLNIMMQNVNRDISNQEFITQDSSQQFVKYSSESSELVLPSNPLMKTPIRYDASNIESRISSGGKKSTSKNQRNRIRRKLKKLLLKENVRKTAAPSPDDDKLFDPSILAIDHGRIHHINRSFPTIQVIIYYLLFFNE